MLFIKWLITIDGLPDRTVQTDDWSREKFDQENVKLKWDSKWA